MIHDNDYIRHVIFLKNGEKVVIIQRSSSHPRPVQESVYPGQGMAAVTS